jgi:hypothetical protein
LIHVHAAPVGDEIEDGTTEEIWQVEMREADGGTRDILQDALRHLTRFRIQRVAEVHEHDRNFRMIETVERERNHFDGACARLFGGHGAVVCVEVASLRVALPAAQSFVAEGIFDVEKAFIKTSFTFGFNVRACDPEERVRGVAVGQFERFEV